eukprot:370351-Prymnesium_polylepis.1
MGIEVAALEQPFQGAPRAPDPEDVVIAALMQEADGYGKLNATAPMGSFAAQGHAGYQAATGAGLEADVLPDPNAQLPALMFAVSSTAGTTSVQSLGVLSALATELQ